MSDEMSPAELERDRLAAEVADVRKFAEFEATKARDYAEQIRELTEERDRLAAEVASLQAALTEALAAVRGES